MRHFTLVPWLLLPLILICLSLPAQSGVPPVLSDLLQQKLDQLVDLYDVPGISAALILPDGSQWNGAAGLSHIYDGTPMDTTLLFEQASVTKLYVGTTIMQLVRDGLVSLDDSLGTYLPPLPNVPGSIKVRSLLGHRSGIYDFLANPTAPNTWFNNPGVIWTPAEVITTYLLPPVFAEGTTFQYSNTNFLLLGMIVEAVTGQSLAAELHTRFFTPYGLDQTFLPHIDTINGPLVSAWTSFTQANTYDTDAAIIFNPASYSMAWAAGALVAKPAEVARFVRLVFEGTLLPDSLLTTMQQVTPVTGTNGNTGFGLACMRFSYNGRVYYGHAGDINGYTALAIHRRQDSVSLAVSINRNNAPRGPIAAALLQIVNAWLASSAAPSPSANALTISVLPNPALDRVAVEGTLSRTGDVQIEWIDPDGRIARTTCHTGLPAGAFSLSCEVAGLVPGLYLCRVRAGDRVTARRVVIVK